MKYVIGIDPGTTTGIGLFADTKLIQTHRLVDKQKDYALRLHSLTRQFLDLDLPQGTYIIERPQMYQGARQKKDVDLDDVGLVACMAGAFAALCWPSESLLVFPAQWKGQVPKSIHNNRVLDRLSPEERKALGKKDHNVIDGVGLGLWYLRRMGR